MEAELNGSLSFQSLWPAAASASNAKRAKQNATPNTPGMDFLCVALLGAGEKVSVSMLIFKCKPGCKGQLYKQHAE